jgi:predicted CXXCH cytochrome family protein
MGRVFPVHPRAHQSKAPQALIENQKQYCRPCHTVIEPVPNPIIKEVEHGQAAEDMGLRSAQPIKVTEPRVRQGYYPWPALQRRTIKHL